jgi:hypothetical protein
MMLFCVAVLIVSDVPKDAMPLSPGSRTRDVTLTIHTLRMYVCKAYIPEDSNI